MDDEIRKNGLSFSFKKGRTIIYRATIRELGKPEYVRFLLNKKNKTVAVQCCEAIDKDRFKVPEFTKKNKGQFEISSLNFLTMLYKLEGWDQTKNYHLHGYVVPKYRLILFYLDDAVQIGDEDFMDPES